MRKIVLSHTYPPIPTRQFDWTCYRDDNDGTPCGHGPTPRDAVIDMLMSEDAIFPRLTSRFLLAFAVVKRYI